MRSFPLVLVAGLVACGASTSPRVENVEVATTPPPSSVQQRLLAQPVEGYAVVAEDIVLHRTKEAAARSTQVGAKSGAVNLRIVKDHGDAIEVETRNGARSCVTSFSSAYELRVFVPRSALRLVVRDYVVERFEDGTGLILEPGTPVEIRGEGLVPDVSFARDTGYTLAEAKVGFSFRGSEDGSPPTLAPLAEATCEDRERPRSLRDDDREGSRARAKEPSSAPSKPKPPAKRDPKAAELGRQAEAIQKQLLEALAKGSATGSLGRSEIPPVDFSAAGSSAAGIRGLDRPLPPAACRVELGPETKATFASKPISFADDLGYASPKVSRSAGAGFLATIGTQCATVRFGVASENVRSEARGGGGAIAGMGARGSDKPKTRKERYLRKGAVATWPDGTVAGPITLQLRLGANAEEDRDRICVPVHNLAEKLCHAKTDVIDVEVPAY